MNPPPSWLADFSDRCSLLIEGYDLLAPIGCHFHHNINLDEWEISLFASYTEVIGKECDGQLTLSKFSINVMKVIALFDELDSCSWQTHPLDDGDDLGPHLSFCGDYLGHRVWLRVLATPPSTAEVGRLIDVNHSRMEDLW